MNCFTYEYDSDQALDIVWGCSYNPEDNDEIIMILKIKDKFASVASSIDTNNCLVHKIYFKEDPSWFTEEEAYALLSSCQEAGYVTAINRWDDYYETKDDRNLKVVTSYDFSYNVNLSPVISSTLSEEPDKIINGLINLFSCKAIMFETPFNEDFTKEEALTYISKVVKDIFPEEKNNLALFHPLFQNLRSFFSIVVKKSYRDSFDLILKHFNLRTLDPGHDYLPVVYALDNTDKYFIQALFDNINWDEYKLSDGMLWSKMPQEFKKTIREKYSCKWSQDFLLKIQ